MEFLAFRLYAPMASWGEPAVGEHRPTHGYPGRSAVLGILAAALGMRRDEEKRLTELAESYAVGVAVYSTGQLLRDYHTVQVPSARDLKDRPHDTRADELAVPRMRLNTVLSTRDYRQDALSIALVWPKVPAVPWALEVLRDALRSPRFSLYLGRRCCPPAISLQPQCVTAATLSEALSQAQFHPIDHLRDADRLLRVTWEDSALIEHGFAAAAVLSAPRKDEPLSRRRWQFADRREWVALVAKPEITSPEDAS
jgi:CRISPR system Cascade subunit CasD